MNGKAVAVGLGATVSVLLLMAAAGSVMAYALPGPLSISVPTAELEDVKMYGGTYSGKNVAGEGLVDNGASTPLGEPVVVQEIGELNCPAGQTITRTMEISGTGLEIESVIKMDNANLKNVFMKASELETAEGSLFEIEMETMPGPGGGTEAQGLVQTITNGTMENLVTLAYYVEMDSMVYEDMSIYINTYAPSP